MGPRWFVGVSGVKLLGMRCWERLLARLRSEGNGCPFLDLQEVTRTTAISLELEGARGVSPPGPPGTGSRRQQA